MIQFDPKNIQIEQLYVFFDEWASLKTIIQKAHERRSSDMKAPMLNAIELYGNLLSRVSSDHGFEPLRLKEYEVLPLNGEERLLFIMRKPEQYAAFRQLDELFEETRKKIARLRVQYK